MGRTGTDFRALLGPLSGEKREALIRAALDAGEVPSWSKPTFPVTLNMTINGTPHELTYWVSPDTLALGTDSDYVRVKPWPSTFQWYADKNNYVLPTSRMSDQIYTAALYKFKPHPVHPHSISTESWFKSDDILKAEGDLAGYAPGVGLAAGHLKDVVNGPGLSGKQVAIYGWHDPTGTVVGRPGPIQTFSTVHEATFSDYSHGARLINRMGVLDGHEVDLGKVMTDPVLYPLLSKMVGEAGTVGGEGGPLTNDRFPVDNTNSPTIQMSASDLEPTPGMAQYGVDSTSTTLASAGPLTAPTVSPGGGSGDGGSVVTPHGGAIASLVGPPDSTISKVLKVGGVIGCVGLVGWGVSSMLKQRRQERYSR
jgi:hypothetical protein